MALSSIAPASWSAPALWRFSGVSRPSQSSTGVEHSRTLSRRLLAAFVILHSSFVIAAEPTPPTRTELWLPSSKLDSFLKKNPKAVLLTPEQYNALIRDAGKTEPKVDPALEAPKSLVIEHLDLKGTVEPGATSIMLRGVLTVNVPADGWASGSLAWPYFFDISQTEPPREGPMLAWITQDEFKADKLPAETMRSLSLAVRGPGRRTLHFRGTLPLYYRLRSGERSLDLQHIGCGGQITLTLPQGAELLPGSAVQKKIGYTVTAAFDHRFIRRSDNGDPLTSIPVDKKTAGATLPDAVRIRWTDPQHESDIEPLRLIDTGGSMHFGVSDSRLETRLHFAAHVRRGQKGQHETAWPILGGADTQVTAVSGPDVLAWRQDGETLHVTLSQSTAAAPIDIALSRPLLLTAASTLVLPSLKLPLTLAAELHTAEGVDLLALEGLRGNSLRLDAAAPQITLRPATARLEADVDVAAKLDRDSLRIERTLNLRSDRPVSSVKLVLPEGEEFIAVLRQDQSSIANASQPSITANIISAPIFADFTWRRVGSAITLLFAKPFTSTGEKIIITSRQKLLKAWSGPKTPETLTLGHLSIPEAVKVAGYTALDFDDSWRVSLKSANGLEDRDARLTPVKGRMAWFGLREHALTVEVERAEAVFSAEVTAYALPRARSIEIEGQFTLDISGAPLRRFQVKLPPATAKLLRVASPLIGEQQLDEATGLWTLTLRQESKGRQNIRWRMSLAAEAGADSLTTTATLPRLEIPSSRRFTGTWIIEANTDTQLSTQAQGMQPLDVLKAPAVADYAPRHRVTSAFSFGVAEHALTLTAQRHAHSELAPLVITHLRLTSVLDAHGPALHEAYAELLHTGEQFIALTLPPGAVLLSTLANGEAVKPVRSSGVRSSGFSPSDGAPQNGLKPELQTTIAIPLPAGSANTPTSVTLQYRLQNPAWAATGTLDLPPVQLAPNVPVLATSWLIHTPKTFSITEPETTLEALDAAEVPNVVMAALQSLGGPWAFISGKSDKRADDVLFSMSASGALDIDPVEAVERGLLLASRSSELGNYDQGIAHYQEVLRIDPHNSAARRGIENAERKRQQYFKTAYDQQRMLSSVDEMWEDKVPTAAATSSTRSAGAFLTSKMDLIIMPEVKFDNATMEQAIEFLRLKSRELDNTESDPSRKGVNIILRTGDAPAAASISLDLKNVPMSEALRYVCDLAQMKFKVEAYAVVVVPISDNNTEMFSRTYRLQKGMKFDKEIKSALQEQGIVFPDGAAAGFDAQRSELIVRNSQPNLDLVEALVEEINSGRPLSPPAAAAPAPGRAMGDVSVSPADPFAAPQLPQSSPVGAKPGAAPLFKSKEELTLSRGKSGLLPLAVEMPSEGRVLRFAGHQAPPVLHLRYISWERQMLAAVLAMLGGMVAFALFAWRRRPWIATLLVIILAALAFPLLLEGDALALANAAAFGWVTMFVVRVLAGVMKRLPVHEDVCGEEVAV